MGLVRSPNLVAYWRNGAFYVEEFVRRRRIKATPTVVQLLDHFGKPSSMRNASPHIAGVRSASIRLAIRRLSRWGFLVPATDRRWRRDAAAAWKGSFAAAHYHFATKDPIYERDPEALVRHYRQRLAEEPQPPLYREYRGRPRAVLPPDDSASADVRLEEALRRRRTTRHFARRPVGLSDFARVVRGTWGQTGWLDGGVFGKLITKTSPSAGARHPIECYVVAWRVAGLDPGLYHFSVRGHRLEALRRGDFRALAVRMAGGQAWVKRAAFLCVMTAVADRVFWKYSSADAYRLFLLDAGHLAQTFVLLATASGLGAFTTAAISERTIEDALDLDGLREFPVYVCGAGTAMSPGKDRSGPRLRAGGP